MNELLNLYITIGVGVYCARMCRAAQPGAFMLFVMVLSLVVVVIWPWTLIATFGERRRLDRAYGEQLVKTALHFKQMEN